MAGYFQNEFGKVYVDAAPIVWMGILPELLESEAFYPLSGAEHGTVPDLFRSKYQPSRDDVQIRFTEDGQVAVELAVQVNYGVPVRPAALKLQENIERAIATTTGLVVQKVDIKVDRIRFPEAKTLPEPDPDAQALDYSE